MATFNQQLPLSAFYDDPDFVTDKKGKLQMALGGYKANGQSNGFGKVLDFALPAIGGIAGAVIGGPSGAAIGTQLGGLARKGQGANARKLATSLGADDTAENISAGEGQSAAKAGLVGGLSGLINASVSGLSSMGGAGTTMKTANDTFGTGFMKGMEGVDLKEDLLSSLGLLPMALSKPANAAQKRGVSYFAEGGKADPVKTKRGDTAYDWMRTPLADILAERKELSGQERDFSSDLADGAYGVGRIKTNTAAPIGPEWKMNDIASGYETGTSPQPWLKTKSDKVNVSNLDPAILQYLDSIPDHLKQNVLVTSGNDQNDIRGSKSKHRSNMALDLRYNKELHEYIANDPAAKRAGLRVLDPNHGTAAHTHLERYVDGGAPKNDLSPFYSPEDKTEDLAMIDMKTGKLFGAMRYGERIYDQQATNHIDGKVSEMAKDPKAKNKKNFAALGEFLFNETMTHKDIQEGISAFAEGGKPTAKDKVVKVGANRYVSKASVKGNKATVYKVENGKFVDTGETMPVKYFERDGGKLPAVQIEGGRVIDLSSGANYQNFQGLQSGLGRYEGYGNTRAADDVLRGDSDKKVKPGMGAFYSDTFGKPMDYSTPPAKQNTPPATTGTNTAASVLNVDGTTPAAPKKRSKVDALLGTPPKGTPPPIGSFLPPEIGAIDTPAPPTSASDASQYSPRQLSSIMELDLMPGIDLGDKAAKPPITEAKPPLSDKFAGFSGGDAVDLARVGLGLSQAMKPLPDYKLPAEWGQYVSKSKQMSETGLPAETLALLDRRNATNNAMGVNNIRQTIGAGGGTGAALAAIAGMNLNAGDQALQLSSADANTRTNNFNRYGAVLGQDIAYDQDNFSRKYNTALATTQAGAGLVQAGLKNIEERSLYNKTQPLIDELLRAQIEKEKRTSAQTEATIIANAKKLTNG